MSAAPYDILRYFDADEDELKLVAVSARKAGEDGPSDEWYAVPEDMQALDSTLLVLWYRTGGIRRIAVQHEERVVEFDLGEVILRAGPLTGVERVAP